jgi:hypothetical protein
MLLTLVLSGLGALGKYLVPRKSKKDGTPPKLERRWGTAVLCSMGS